MILIYKYSVCKVILFLGIFYIYNTWLLNYLVYNYLHTETLIWAPFNKALTTLVSQWQQEINPAKLHCKFSPYLVHQIMYYFSKWFSTFFQTHQNTQNLPLKQHRQTTDFIQLTNSIQTVIWKNITAW